MIPEKMESLLRERLPGEAWEGRVVRQNGLAFAEFGPLDVERLARLGIEVDPLGPRLVVCMWDEAAPLEVGGYLVVDNLAMGRPSMGGIRMLPDVTPSAVHNLARGMTLKNAAANLPYGGGKSGIVAGRELGPEERTQVIRRFARLLQRYRDIYLPGPDVGTNDADMKTVAIENGLDSALSKPAEMGGNRIDQLGAAAGGVVIALETLLEEMPRLRALPQFASLELPAAEGLTVLIQGFGAVGANAARFIHERHPEARVVGVSDETGYLYNPAGLPIDALIDRWQRDRLVARGFFVDALSRPSPPPPGTKFSTAPDDLLRESAFCLIPAAPTPNYLDLEADSGPSMTTDRMGRWALIVEGANTYSPDAARRLRRARLERRVYREQGILIATDYLVNSGGVIFAAQERVIKTPDSLRIPDDYLGEPPAVERWLEDHAAELHALAETRRQAGAGYRDAVIRGNMRELIDLLVSDADMLPCEAAERISVRRIARRESQRTAADIMEPIPTAATSSSVQLAAGLLVEAGSPILAVVTEQGELAGVVTEWDITRATSRQAPGAATLIDIMTPQVVAAAPGDSLLELVRKLEHHEISAMPVVDGGAVVGMVSTDLLARRSLLRLLLSESEG